jgi:hypothetical protein
VNEIAIIALRRMKTMQVSLSLNETTCATSFVKRLPTAVWLIMPDTSETPPNSPKKWRDTEAYIRLLKARKPGHLEKLPRLIALPRILWAAYLDKRITIDQAVAIEALESAR